MASSARANGNVPENRPYKAENAMTAPALREGSQSPRTSTVHTAAAGMKHFNLPMPCRSPVARQRAHIST